MAGQHTLYIGPESDAAAIEYMRTLSKQADGVTAVNDISARRRRAADGAQNSGAADMIPDIAKHNPDPQYLRELLARAGLTQAAAAEKLGLIPRTMRSYLQADGGLTAPYPVQFCLEALARAPKGKVDE